MSRVLFTAFKAGSGKSTLSLTMGALAYEVWGEGVQVCFKDIDYDQNTLSTFVDLLGLKNYPEEEANLILVDSGAKQKGLESEFKAADKIVLVCNPGLIDIRVNEKFAKEELRPYKKKTCILWNRVRSNVRLENDIVSGAEPYDSYFKGFKKLKSYIKLSSEYGKFMETGKLIKKTADELGRVMLELKIS